MFNIKAKTPTTLQCMDFSTLEQQRKIFSELDKELIRYEKYIEEYGSPICDYSIPRSKSLLTKFKNSVRRAIAFNQYKHKKKSKLTKLIGELKQQKEEWLEKEERKK